MSGYGGQVDSCSVSQETLSSLIGVIGSMSKDLEKTAETILGTIRGNENGPMCSETSTSTRDLLTLARNIASTLARVDSKLNEIKEIL